MADKLKPEKEIERWITVKGARVPIFKDGSFGGPKALREMLQKSMVNNPDSDLPPEVRMANLLAKKGIHDEQAIADYLRSLTPARRSILAGQMGVTSRGDAKIKEISHRIYMVNHKEDKPEPKPEPKKEEVKPEIKKEEPKKENGSDYKVKNFQPYPEYKSIIGEQHEVKNPTNRLVECQDKCYINPHYGEGNKLYHNNCALCTVASELQARGYDVEAMPRDPDPKGEKGKNWRGTYTIFDFDYDNPDNFIISGNTAKSGLFRLSHLVRLRAKNALNSEKYQKIMQMPKGAKQASKLIVDRVKGWGDGARGELNVSWREDGPYIGHHSVMILNRRGRVYIYDAQDNSATSHIEDFLRDTKVNHTELVRLDNARLRTRMEKSLEKMVQIRQPRSMSVGDQIDFALRHRVDTADRLDLYDELDERERR